MILDNYIAADKAWLLSWNGSDSLFWDGFMWLATATWVWIPAMLILLYIILKNNEIREALLIIVLLALTVAVADGVASGICKPFFARFRPAQDPEIMYMVDVVNGYRGGLYGFISSHAANTFSATVFLSFLVKRKSFTIVLLLWAVLHSYSRIYLGVHYPGDILFGMVEGCITGGVFYLLCRFLQKRLFYRPNWISNRYTAGGYLISDIRFFHTVFLFTCLFLIIAGMVLIRILHL